MKSKTCIKKRKVWGLFLGIVFILSVLPAYAAELAYYSEGSVAPDYEWWYGCSPTSAGMMVGYYDINGYSGSTFNNLVQGGTAETSTFPSTAGSWDYLAQYAIASPGHVSAFYISGYLGSGDDIPGNHVAFDSLADFMGTSQDSVGNVNGSTTFYYWTNGAKFTEADAMLYGVADSDGMYGIGEYVNYTGYDVSNLFTQATDNLGLPYGFTFADYMAEIDAGRVVMIHVEGHSMFGYGYDVVGNTVKLHETWVEGEDTMTWGGSFAGMDMWGVTCFTPTGGGTPSVPEPSTFLLLGFALSGLAYYRKKGIQ